MFKREEIKMESIVAQLDFFSALQNRHELWVADVDNPQIAQLHFEIIDSLVEITDKYKRLLNLYKKNHDE